MTLINQVALDVAGADYEAACTELRRAYGCLGAVSLALTGNTGFGTPPEVTPLRHARYAQTLSGSFADDIKAARAAL